MKLTVAITATKKVAYDTIEVAVCKLEVEQGDSSPRGLRSGLEALTEDALERVTAQLRCVEKANAAAERENEEVCDEASAF